MSALDQSNKSMTYQVRYPTILKRANNMIMSMWVADVVDFEGDKGDYSKLTVEERRLLDGVLGFFAVADSIINDNLMDNFLQRIHITEAQHMFLAQATIEMVHQRTYTQFVESLITDPVRRQEVLDAPSHLASVKAKVDLMREWGSDASWDTLETLGIEKARAMEKHLGEHLVAFAAAEGVGFMASFVIIFWLKSNGLMENLGKANEFIARDEGEHRDGQVDLFWSIVNHEAADISDDRIFDIVNQFVMVEKQYAAELLPEPIRDLSKEKIGEFIESIADVLLSKLKCKRRYGTQNPFEFMKFMAMEAKANFFENRPSEYAKPGTVMKLDLDDDDF